MIPFRATYRLQLNAGFTLRDATALVPYLDRLGVSHAYLSPVLKAQPGSTHGYDCVDHRVINPETGTLEDFRALARALRARNMGILLDFVPNHMGVGGADNALWLDVLRYGPQSGYADWFDIDWHPRRPGMAGKLLVPFLGTSYSEALRTGALRLKADGEELAVWAYDKEKLPVRPEDGSALLRQHGSTAAVLAAYDSKTEPGRRELDRLIARQHWRLAHFATAPDEINYRRFFINNELAGIRIDRPDVFDHAHGLIFQLIAEGLVDGLRIDHVDGLLDPHNYLQTLKAKAPGPIYLAVEKILAPHEYLRSDWPVEGTTGYEVGAQLTRLLTHGPGEGAITAIYTDFVGPHLSPHEEAHRCKLRVMDNELAVELDNLAADVANLAWSVPDSSDLTQNGLKRALREIVAQLSVYRTYSDEKGMSPRDRREIDRAIGRARQAQLQVQPAVFDFVAVLLLGRLDRRYDAASARAITGRMQQYSGPVMAKGLEDTALYRCNRLVSLNEVGAHPDRFSLGIAAFHDANRRRLDKHALGMIGTSTHDTKRGEDIRLVISAIADAPDMWAEAVKDWRALLGVEASGLHPNDVYLFLQMLLGGWPMDGEAGDLAERLKGAMTKSLREARERSDWAVNATDYEKAMSDFVDRAVANTDFLARFRPVQEAYAAIGRRKALIQTVLKFTIPGIPDIYRGAEDWEQSFMDPDNRRSLDFVALERRLDAPIAERDDKIVLTQSLLALRRQEPALFSKGSYEPLGLGPEVLGFRRVFDGRVLTVLADLSAGHRRALPNMSGTPLAGGRGGPTWVLVSE